MQPEENRVDSPGRRRALLAWCLAFALLLAGFRWNVWGAVSAETFATTQRDTEGLVFGRLAVARAQGFAAHGALLQTTRGDSSQIDLDELLHVAKGGSARIKR